MIKCDKCETANRVGAIFCKSCGQRLNLENAEEQIQETQRRERRSLKSIMTHVRRYLTPVILIFVVLILIGIFLRPPMKFQEHGAAGVFTETQDKYYRMLQPESRDRIDPQFVFSSAEATALVNYLTNLRGEEEIEEIEQTGFALTPQVISVNFLASGYVRLVLKSLTVKDIGVYTTIVGRFETRNDNLDFIIHSGRIGKIPMPGPFRGIAIGRFEALMDRQDIISQLRTIIDYIVVRNDEAVVHLKRKIES